MKALLCLAVLLAVSSAAFLPQQSSPGPFTPKWIITNNFYNDFWVPTDVFSKGNPGAGGYNQVVVCAKPKVGTFPKQWRFQLTDGKTFTEESISGVTYEPLFKDRQCLSVNYQVEENYTSQYSLLLTLESFDEYLVSLQVFFTL